MDFKEYAGLLAEVITIFAYLPYIYRMLLGKNHPSKATWFVLALMGFTSFFYYRDLGADYTLGVALANFIGPTLVFLFTLKFGISRTGGGDYKFLFLSFVAIVIWILSGNSFIALLFNLAADFFGFIPTIIKSWHQPQSEDFLSWCLFVIAGFINLFAIVEWNIEIAVYPVYVVSAETLLLMVILGRKFLRNNLTTS